VKYSSARTFRWRLFKLPGINSGNELLMEGLRAGIHVL